jgi:lipopolysaccharide/colanic/teichoic acid biosynthesis glycosyltransferase
MTSGIRVVHETASREPDKGNPEQKDKAALRRLFDVVFAACALLLILPAFLIISIMVYSDGGAPIFFRQTRIGLHGRPFLLYKFRKFGPAEPANGLAVTLANDRRLTKVGRILERTKLDELPQLWNVLRGDMALVGPRPESLNFADCFTGPFGDLMDHKPGIFGPAQARFRNESDYYVPDENPEQLYRRLLFPAKATIDLRYYGTRTLVRDVAWIWRGITAVIHLTRVPPGNDQHLPASGMPALMRLANNMIVDAHDEL